MGDLQQKFDASMEESELLQTIEAVGQKKCFAKVGCRCLLEEEFRKSPYFRFRRCKCFKHTKNPKRYPPYPHRKSPLRNIVSVDDFEATKETLPLEEGESLERQSKKRKREEVEGFGGGVTASLAPSLLDTTMMESGVVDSIEPAQSLIDPSLDFSTSMMELITGESIAPTQSPINPLLSGTPMMEFSMGDNIDHSQSWPPSSLHPDPVLPSIYDDPMWESSTLDSLEPAQCSGSYAADESAGETLLSSDNFFGENIEVGIFQDGQADGSEANPVGTGTTDYGSWYAGR